MRRSSPPKNDPLTKYRALVVLDGPWVHMENVERGDGLGEDLAWQPHADLSLNADGVSSIEWTT